MSGPTREQYEDELRERQEAREEQTLEYLKLSSEALVELVKVLQQMNVVLEDLRDR